MTSVNGQAPDSRPQGSRTTPHRLAGPGSLRLNASGELEVAVAGVNHTLPLGQALAGAEHAVNRPSPPRPKRQHGAPSPVLLLVLRLRQCWSAARVVCSSPADRAVSKHDVRPNESRPAFAGVGAQRLDGVESVDPAAVRPGVGRRHGMGVGTNLTMASATAPGLSIGTHVLVPGTGTSVAPGNSEASRCASVIGKKSHECPQISRTGRSNRAIASAASMRSCGRSASRAERATVCGARFCVREFVPPRRSRRL
jgi:hypothetical protein